MRALILVDLQPDFLPGGALAVPEGDQVLPIANAIQPHFDLVVATQDWHPLDHGSFAANHPGHTPGQQIDLAGLPQILWPVHCVQDTPAAALAPGLDQHRLERVFRKGTDPQIDSYSGFYDNGHRKATGMGAYLKEKGVRDVYLVGLAADYCVKYTALDAIQEGFSTTLIVDGTRGVNLQPQDTDLALSEMQQAGVKLTQSQDLDLG